MENKCLKFTSAQHMLQTIQRNNDLYNPEAGIYVFLYNEVGSIAYYSLFADDAYELACKAEASNEYWAGFLGAGGLICDDPSHELFREGNISNLDWCEEYWDVPGWYTCEAWYTAEKERHQNSSLHVTNIDWDVDNVEDAENLPKEVLITPAIHPDNVAYYLSDTYGWCVNGFVVEE